MSLDTVFSVGAPVSTLVANQNLDQIPHALQFFFQDRKVPMVPLMTIFLC